MTIIWLHRRHVTFPSLNPGWCRVSAADAATLMGDGVAQDGFLDVRALKHIERTDAYDPTP